MPFVATNGFETKTASFYRDQSLLTTKYLMEVFSHGESGFRGLSLWLFLLKEKSVIYHLRGRDKEDWGAETHDFQGKLKGHQSTPTCYKGGGGTKENCLPINFQ